MSGGGEPQFASRLPGNEDSFAGPSAGEDGPETHDSQLTTHDSRLDTHSLLDPSVLRLLLTALERSDIDELEIDDGHARVYVRREPGRSLSVVGSPMSAGGQAPEGEPIKAPLTGVYYSRPTPDQPAFVEEGDLIVEGQVVALIETMKLFNEVAAEVGGEVTRLLHRDGDLVEADQPLMFVRVQAEGEAE